MRNALLSLSLLSLACGPGSTPPTATTWVEEVRQLHLGQQASVAPRPYRDASGQVAGVLHTIYVSAAPIDCSRDLLEQIEEGAGYVSLRDPLGEAPGVYDGQRAAVVGGPFGEGSAPQLLEVQQIEPGHYVGDLLVEDGAGQLLQAGVDAKPCEAALR